MYAGIHNDNYNRGVHARHLIAHPLENRIGIGRGRSGGKVYKLKMMIQTCLAAADFVHNLKLEEL
jgi:hypothetical protein